MLQEIDLSTVLTALWSGWLYWCVYTWMNQIAAEAERNKEQDGRPVEAGVRHNGEAGEPPVQPGAGEAVLSVLIRQGSVSSIDVFLADALALSETVLAAYHRGNRDTLLRLVSADVFAAFAKATAARGDGEEEILLSRIERPETMDGSIEATRAVISVRFAAELYRSPRNAAAPARAERLRTVDIWTLERVLAPRSESWRVIATEAGH